MKKNNPKKPFFGEEKKDQEPPKEADLVGELRLHGKREQEEGEKSLLVTTRSHSIKKEKREHPLRILPKEDFLKASQRSEANVFPLLEEVKKTAKEEDLEASLLGKSLLVQKNGRAKSLLLFLKNHLEKSPVDLKRKRVQKESLTLPLEIRSPIPNVVVPMIKSPIRTEINLELKMKVFRRVQVTGRKRDTRKISLPKSRV